MAERKKLIFDTDMGGDCDDAGAVAVMCSLAKSGEAEILAATYCIGNPWGAYFLKYELEYFGFGHVPVGVLKDDAFMTEPIYEKYTRPYVERIGAPQEQKEDAVRVLRRALAENGGIRDITLIAVGPLRNIANLLRSGADDISPKTGRELIAENVMEFVTMLGAFAEPGMVEWNVKMDIPSAKYCVEQMPSPIVFLPMEAGVHIITGRSLAAADENHPVRAAYTLWNDGKCHVRSSWDPITVYCAIRDDTPLYTRMPMHVILNERGETISHPGDDMACLIQIASDEEIVSVLDALILS